MKRIIGDKLYDTDKATLVAKACNEYSDEYDDEYSDENSDEYRVLVGTFSPAIYLKRTGEWFLYCEGGLYDRYGRLCMGLNIIPIAPHEAKFWLAENNFVDEYIQYFGEPEE